MENKPQFSNIDMQELISEFNNSTEYVRQYTRDFPDLDNLVDAIPVTKEGDTPYIGDTTIAGLVRAIPRAAFKDLPVLGMVVNGSKKSVPAIFCKYLIRGKIFNEDTFGKGLLSTIRIGTEEAIGHGFAAFLTAGESLYREFGTRLRHIHSSDFGIEPGVSDSGESAYSYVASHLPRSAVRQILKNAKKTADTSWNIEAVEQLLKQSPQGKSYAEYESAARVNTSGESFNNTYTLVTRYETGPQPTYITFALEYPDAPLRIITTKSKWGYPRVQLLVIDPVSLNPFGISRVRLASPIQNITNIFLANIGYMLLLNSNPPIFKSGTFLKSPQLKRGALWEALDPNAKVQLMTMDNGALSQFVPMMEHLSGQIQNIMGGQTVTVNSGGGANGFSKTAPGVKQAQEYLNNEINQITKILDSFVRQYVLSGLDTYLCEKSGTEEVIVDDECKNQINEVAPGLVDDNNRMFMDWDALYDMIKEWSVEVDVSMSKDELKDQELSDMQDLIVMLGQTGEGDPRRQALVDQLSNMLIREKVPLANELPAMAPPDPMAGQPLDSQLTEQPPLM